MTSFTLNSTVKLRSGIEMPILGLGVYANDDCYPACKVALQNGYKLIDTAEYYGNEEAVGRAVRDSGIPREQLFIITKVYSGNHGYEKTIAEVEQSLKKMNIGYIDLYLIHDPQSGKEKRLEAYRALLDAKKAGKVRAVGVSNYNPKHLQEIKEAGLEMPEVNQIELHPFCQQKEIVQCNNEHGIVSQAYCPLIRAKFDSPVLQGIAKKVNKSVPQVLIRWSIQRGFSPIPKSANPERIKSNVDIYDFSLSPEDMDAINALDQGQAGAISWNPIDAE
ncbi:Aldo/keto reductase [Agrocybe pediades]|nr:Aldo/keto reductase [Agrocybe pediades]